LVLHLGGNTRLTAPVNIVGRDEIVVLIDCEGEVLGLLGSVGEVDAGELLLGEVGELGGTHLPGLSRVSVMELSLHGVGGEDGESVGILSTRVFLVVGLLELVELSQVVSGGGLGGLGVEEESSSNKCDASNKEDLVHFILLI